MSDKKLPCDNCYSTYKDEKQCLRCEPHKHKTEGYFAEEICLEKGYYYPPQEENPAAWRI